MTLYENPGTFRYKRNVNTPISFCKKTKFYEFCKHIFFRKYVKDDGIVHANSKDWIDIRETVCMISTRSVVV
jgi:hypothetical protein